MTDQSTAKQQPQAANLRQQETVVPINKLLVVKKDHELAKLFYTPRNDWTPEQSMVDSIKAKGRPDYPPLVWPYEDLFVVIDGNQRVTAAMRGDLDKLPVVIRKDWTKEEAVRAAARLNSQRKDNDFLTNAIVAIRLLQLGKDGKPKGMTFEQVANEFGKSHTTIRQWVKMYQLFPDTVKKAVSAGKLPIAAAIQILNNKEIMSGEDSKEKIATEAQRIMAEGGPVTNEAGKIGKKGKKSKTASASGGDGVKKNEWRLIAQRKDCPPEFGRLISIFIEDKAFASGANEFDELAFLVRPSEKALEEFTATTRGKAANKMREAKEAKSGKKKAAQPKPEDDIDLDLVDEDDDVDEIEEVED